MRRAKKRFVAIAAAASLLVVLVAAAAFLFFGSLRVTLGSQKHTARFDVPFVYLLGQPSIHFANFFQSEDMSQLYIDMTTDLSRVSPVSSSIWRISTPTDDRASRLTVVIYPAMDGRYSDLIRHLSNEKIISDSVIRQAEASSDGIVRVDTSTSNIVNEVTAVWVAKPLFSSIPTLVVCPHFQFIKSCWIYLYNANGYSVRVTFQRENIAQWEKIARLVGTRIEDWRVND